MMQRGTAVIILLCIGMLIGCRRDQGDDQRTGTITPEDIAQSRADWPEGVAVYIDSANAAFSAQDHVNALRLYRRATELGPNVSAAWFGIYMTESARGNVATADSAMERAKQLSPGATLLHPSPADTGRNHP